MAVDVVVCAHNEAPRIGSVLDAIVKAKTPGNVITVADRCTDATARIAQDYGLVIPTTAGTKGTAMAVGLGAVETDLVLYIDADLAGLKPQHVDALCTYAPLDGQLVGVRGSLDGFRAPRVLSIWPSISGERRLPADFARSLRLAGRGWETETYVDAMVARTGLPHRQIILRGVSNPSKRGLGKALTEVAHVSAATALYAPELARYVWSST